MAYRLSNVTALIPHWLSIHIDSTLVLSYTGLDEPSYVCRDGTTFAGCEGKLFASFPLDRTLLIDGSLQVLLWSNV